MDLIAWASLSRSRHGGVLTTTGNAHEPQFRASAQRKASSCRPLVIIIVPIPVFVKSEHST